MLTWYQDRDIQIQNEVNEMKNVCILNDQNGHEMVVHFDCFIRDDYGEIILQGVAKTQHSTITKFVHRADLHGDIVHSSMSGESRVAIVEFTDGTRIVI